MSLRGEQLDWGAATLPTLSSLSRINDGVRPLSIHELAGLLRTHMHALPPPRTHPPRLIYTDMLSPCHATFTLHNAEGRDSCFWFPTRGQHLNGRRQSTLQRPPSSPALRFLLRPPFVSLQMKWTNAKSMFLVLLITIFIPTLPLFPCRLRGY